jgi:hypothetical protein
MRLSGQGGERAAIAAARMIVSQPVAFPLRWGCVSLSGRDSTDYGDSQAHLPVLRRSIRVLERENTMRHFLPLVSALIALTLLATPAASAALPIMKAQIALSETNQPDSLWAASDTQLVYLRDNPAMHPPNCVSCGDPPFTDFRVTFYEVDLHATRTGLRTTQPRPLFTLDTGVHAAIFSVVRGWVIYEPYSATQGPENGGPWTLIAHNIASGREIVLDSRDMEQLPSIGAGAEDDGTTVIWGTWTKGPNGGTSIIRTYNVLTGTRSVVAQGGSPSNGYYTWAAISGTKAVYEKVANRHFQIILKDLTTGRTQALTPAGRDYSQPTISGDIVAYEDGAQFSQGKGIVIRNLTTGKTVEYHAYDAQGPRALMGRYVVWTYGKRVSDASYYLRLYDSSTGHDRSLFQPNNGWGTGNVMRASRHTVVFSGGKAAVQKGHFVTRVTVAHLP